MNLCFVDFESQGTDHATTHPTEVGAILIESGVGKIGELSSLIYEPHYPPQSEEIVELTGITDQMLKSEGRPTADVFHDLNLLLGQADYAVAHNAQFDRGVYEATCKRFGKAPVQPKSGWVCTIRDVPWAAKYKCKKLSHLAFDHGIFAEKDKLHRAVYDCELLARLIGHFWQFEDIIKYRDTPWVYIQAEVCGPWVDAGKETGEAKKLGFSWEKCFGDDKSFPKSWITRVKADKVEAFQKAAPWPTRIRSPQ